MKPESKKLKKSAIILIAILVIIIALIIAIVVVQKSNYKKQQAKSSVSSTSAVSNVSQTSPVEEEDGADVSGTEHFVKKGNNYILMLGKDRLEVTGLYYCKLPGTSKKDCYYFNDGVYDKSHNGVEVIPGDAPEAKYEYAYVKNGKIDRKYTGLISKDNYLRIFENGKYRYDFSGKIHMPDGDYDVHHGAVYGYCLGRPDNFEWKPWFWFLDGEPDMYHTNG